MGVSYVKSCPRCRTTAAVDAALCSKCGHRFRTYFQPRTFEKTIAMTHGPDGLQPVPGPPAEPLPQSRPVQWPRLVLIAAALLVAGGLFYGAHMRQTRRSVSAPRAVFRPYDVVIWGGLQDDPAPMATRSVQDLQQWAAARSPRQEADAAAGDSPARVHLYVSKRIVLVPPGTRGRVLIEQGTWCRVRILGGLHRGATGFISRNAVERLIATSQKTAVAAR